MLGWQVLFLFSLLHCFFFKCWMGHNTAVSPVTSILGFTSFSPLTRLYLLSIIMKKVLPLLAIILLAFQNLNGIP